MPDTSQKFFWPPGGTGGTVNGTSRGASFLKICILGIFGDISSNLSWDKCQKPPKKIFDPQGDQGGQLSGAAGGTVLLKSVFLVFLVIFLQTWAKIDTRSLPKNFLDPRGARGARGASNQGSRGASFLKICLLGIFGNISSNLSWDRWQTPPNFFLLPGGLGGQVNRGQLRGQFS